MRNNRRAKAHFFKALLAATACAVGIILATTVGAVFLPAVVAATAVVGSAILGIVAIRQIYRGGKALVNPDNYQRHFKEPEYNHEHGLNHAPHLDNEISAELLANIRAEVKSELRAEMEKKEPVEAKKLATITELAKEKTDNTPTRRESVSIERT